MEDTETQKAGAAEPKSVRYVVAGLILRGDEVLICQRRPDQAMALKWEFPGGKLEPGEGREEGLARELREELGIAIQGPQPLIQVSHSYPSRDVLLDVWVVKNFSGEPRGLDGQALRWCTQEQLATAELLPADRPIVAALRLPAILARSSTPNYRIGEAAADPHRHAAAEAVPSEAPAADHVAQNRDAAATALAAIAQLPDVLREPATLFFGTSARTRPSRRSSISRCQP